MKNNYIVKEKDLIGDIEGYPIEVVQKMVDYQIEQGNKPDVGVFQENRRHGQGIGGFNWFDTLEGVSFWSEVLLFKEFNLFFKKYPKEENDMGIKKYVVTPRGIKGEIEDFPIEVVQKMVDYQIAQGNTPDVRIFHGDRYSTKSQGGFNWSNTIEGDVFWENVISCKDFHLFFNRYPKYPNEKNQNISYTVTKDDLIYGIENYPLYIVQKMVDHQVEQGNKPDVSVFQKHPAANSGMGGFCWSKTPESKSKGDFWSLIHDKYKSKSYNTVATPADATPKTPAKITPKVLTNWLNVRDAMVVRDTIIKNTNHTYIGSDGNYKKISKWFY